MTRPVPESHTTVKAGRVCEPGGDGFAILIVATTITAQIDYQRTNCFVSVNVEDTPSYSTRLYGEVRRMSPSGR